MGKKVSYLKNKVLTRTPLYFMCLCFALFCLFVFLGGEGGGGGDLKQFFRISVQTPSLSIHMYLFNLYIEREPVGTKPG